MIAFCGPSTTNNKDEELYTSSNGEAEYLSISEGEKEANYEEVQYQDEVNSYTSWGYNKEEMSGQGCLEGSIMCLPKPIPALFASLAAGVGAI